MNRVLQIVRQRPVECVALLLAALFSFGMPAFFDGGNVRNILGQVAPIALLACGQAVVMISGGLDLSQASVVGVSSVSFVFLARSLGVGPAAALTMVFAAGLGMANALLSKVLRNSFIATFATMYVLMGAVIYVTGGTPISELPSSVRGTLSWVGSGMIGGIPVTALFAAVPIAFLAWFLHRSRLGLEIFAWGSNPAAARVHEIREMPVILVSFALSATAAALAGILLSARVLQGNPQMGEGLLFESIAACVVGGIALSGGIGGVWPALRGCLLIAIIQNGLYLSDMNSHVRDIVVGAMIALSVLLSRFRFSRRDSES